MSRYPSLIAVGLALFTVPAISSADSIKLEGGRTIKGQILDDKSTTDVIVVKLQIGNGEVTLDRKQIQEIIREKNAATEYDEIKADYAETADDQFRLAMWCESHKLLIQRKQHLLKVIELNPDHLQAREKLGYVKRGGKWLTANEIKEAKGLVRFNGRYVTPQEKEILEQKKREDDIVKEWHTKIRMWKGWVTGNDIAKSKQGEDRLRTIDDPLALDAVVGQLGKENAESLRILMCDIVGNLPGEQATLELVKRCIVDVSANVRGAATSKLVDRDDPIAVRSLIKALASEHNTEIRRAAEALGAIGDAAAVPALIGALVTKQKQVVSRSGGGSFVGKTTPQIVDREPVVAPGVVAFKPVVGWQQQGIGISGGQTQEVVTVPVENPEVRDALSAITKEDYGFNQIAWRTWLTSQKKNEEIKNRRRPE